MRINIIEVNIGFSFFLIALNTKIDNRIAPISSGNTQFKIIFEVVKLNPVWPSVGFEYDTKIRKKVEKATSRIY